MYTSEDSLSDSTDAILIVSHMTLYFFFFFFSSRRRHTRSKRDWSSDVCSSDLEVMEMNVPFGLGRKWRRLEQLGHEPRFAAAWRSEERRVGKECRSRWSR